eukprot:10654197-Ditylum_brightwellii.AAC.1
MHGTFHFEATPITPPGTKCYIHIKPHKCYTVVMKEKAAQQITDTVKFKHHGAKVPTVTLAERVAKAV